MACRVTVQPGGGSLDVQPDTNLLEALQMLDVSIRTDCGGAGVCGKCLVQSVHGEGLSALDDEELSFLDTDQIEAGYRLACKATITGDATIQIASDVESCSGPQGKKILAPACTPNPAVRRIFIEPEHLSKNESIAETTLQLLADRLEQLTDFSTAVTGRQLRPLLADCSLEDGITLIVHEQRGVTAIFPGKKLHSLGLAVDLGTTTIAAYLCDLEKGTLLSSAAVFNPQRKFGDDVISRISKGSESDAILHEMQRAVVVAIDDLKGQCLTEVGFSSEDVDELVLVGNTTMQTIFSGASPESLGRAPYQPLTMEGQNLAAEDLGLGLKEGTNVYLFPVISGFLGGDSVAAGLGGDLLHQTEPHLIIDIGTNGELLLGCGDHIVATSCATGPALEGAAISCGMRAVVGAIDKVEVAGDGKSLVFHHIGEEEGVAPTGLCGSGLIDVIACMRKVGILEESGRFDSNARGVICDDDGFATACIMVPAASSGTGKHLTLALNDVRAFQLAKSALVVGIEKLLEHYGVKEVSKTCITGAFGAHFNHRNGVTVDMLSEKVTAGQVYGGANLAGAGAMLALFDKRKRQEAEQLASKCIAVELASDPDFNMCFVKRTRFPALHT